MPVSTRASVMPCPSAPYFCHTLGAPLKRTLLSFSSLTIETGCTDRTSDHAHMARAASNDSRAENALPRVAYRYTTSPPLLLASRMAASCECRAADLACRWPDPDSEAPDACARMVASATDGAFITTKYLDTVAAAAI